MKKSIQIIVILLAVFSYSCKKNTDNPVSTTDGSLVLKIDYKVDTKSLLFDSMMYNNAAGNLYSISRLEYFLSGFVFESETGELVNVDKAIYRDARYPNAFLLSNIKLGNYKSLQFNVGLDVKHNKTGAMEANANNLNMIWPDEMGGGYHYAKIEGRFIHTDLSENGFAMHLGTDKMLALHNIIPASIKVNESSPDTLFLTMNVNEWFVNPNTYNFSLQGNYTMGNDSLMLMLKDNAKDIFKIRGN